MNDTELLAALKEAYEAGDLHFHTWCRETGSSAQVCTSCGMVDDHGKLSPQNSKNLDIIFVSCHCDYSSPNPFEEGQ